MITRQVVKIISIGLAILLLLCLLKMPYGYYELVRVMAIISFAILAVHEYKAKNEILVIVFIGLIILFQPFSKITLGRDLWNVTDVVVAVFLLYLSLKRYK